MSDPNDRPLDADAIKAKMQMDDLGDVNRNNITTVDPGFRQTNARRELSMRECNDPSTAAGQNVMANRPAVARWGNLANAERRAGIQHDDNAGEPMADGQSHRRRVRESVETHLRMQGEDGEVPERPAATNLRNQTSSHQYRNTIPRHDDYTTSAGSAVYYNGISNPNQAPPTQGTTRNMNGGTPRTQPAPADQGRHTPRPLPPNEIKRINGNSTHTSPLRKTAIQNAGSNPPSKSQFTKEQLELAKSMSETRTKNLSNSDTVNRNGAKRGPQHSMEPSRPFKSTRPNGPNVGTRRGPVGNPPHQDGATSSRAQTTRPMSRPVRPTRQNAAAPTTGQGWTGRLVENPPFVALPQPVRSPKEKKHHAKTTTTSPKKGESRTEKKTQEKSAAPPTAPVEVHTEETVNGSSTTAARNPAETCTPEFLRAHPRLAHLYAAEPASTASNPSQNRPSPASDAKAPITNTATESTAQVENLMDTVDERTMGNLSNNFAAMTLTPSPGIMASSHAVPPSSPQSTASVAPSNTTSHSIYVQATSSEASFWEWKQGQKPNKGGS